jgi:hypothetical protein
VHILHVDIDVNLNLNAIDVDVVAGRLWHCPTIVLGQPRRRVQDVEVKVNADCSGRGSRQGQRDQNLAVTALADYFFCS